MSVAEDSSVTPRDSVSLGISRRHLLLECFTLEYGTEIHRIVQKYPPIDEVSNTQNSIHLCVNSIAGKPGMKAQGSYKSCTSELLK